MWAINKVAPAILTSRVLPPQPVLPVGGERRPRARILNLFEAVGTFGNPTLGSGYNHKMIATKGRARVARSLLVIDRG